MHLKPSFWHGFIEEILHAHTRGLLNEHRQAIPPPWRKFGVVAAQESGSPLSPLRARLVALAFMVEGLPAKVVAQRLGRNRGTVESWVQRFNAHGLTGLLPTFRGQPGTVLSPAELVHLRHVVQRPPRQVGL
jgi:Homeodomain-like domain